MKPSTAAIAALLLVTCAVTLAIDCKASDANLKHLKDIVCTSIMGHHCSWCPGGNATAHGDWPHQAVYMLNLLDALAAPTTCVNTTYARNGVVGWLNKDASDPSLSGSFVNTWIVFQRGYYNMPYHPGQRIESPWTLGMKCWAMALLNQYWEPAQIQKALAPYGLSIANFTAEYDKADTKLMTLCGEVIANCFVNASYDPSRNGTCVGSYAEFKLGYDWQNTIHPPFKVKYPIGW
jgi:hypothetical protein